MAKKKRKTTSPKKRPTPWLSKQNKVILGSLLILISLALFFSFISFYITWQDDQSLLTEFADRNKTAKNLLNKFGAGVSHFFMYKGFGLASFVFPILLCLTGLYLFLGINTKGLVGKWIWGLVLLIWFSISFGFFGSEQLLLGGQIGYEMNDFLQDYTGKIGVFLLLLFGLTVILVRLFNFSPERMVAALNSLRALFSKTPVNPLEDQESSSVEISLDNDPQKEKAPDPYTQLHIYLKKPKRLMSWLKNW